MHFIISHLVFGCPTWQINENC